MIINALFFNENVIHGIYIDEGSYNFIYQLPQIFYSTLISMFINTIIKFLSLSENNIIYIKQLKNKEISKIKLLQDKLKMKFVLFFIFTFILVLSFTYYITCLCGIYINTQFHLIKDTIISFGFSLIYPFGISLIPCIFRMRALKAKKKDKVCLYNFSKLIQNI